MSEIVSIETTVTIGVQFPEFAESDEKVLVIENVMSIVDIAHFLRPHKHTGEINVPKL
jgi:hypothetical protein